MTRQAQQPRPDITTAMVQRESVPSRPGPLIPQWIAVVVAGA
ncbi:hypothetical protein ACWF82_01935 [Nocardia sp. NPDC055053]